jgi:hypothetical protein
MERENARAFSSLGELFLQTSYSYECPELQLCKFQTLHSPTLSPTKGPPELLTCRVWVDSNVVVTKKEHFWCCDSNIDRPFRKYPHRLSYHDSLAYVQSIVTKTDKISLFILKLFSPTNAHFIVQHVAPTMQNF